jgi:hypothetical protein
MLSFSQFLTEEPKILKRLVSQLKAKGMNASKAYPVAVSQLQKAGVLGAGSTDLTPLGAVRDQMSAEERAIDRAAKYSGRNPEEFVYSSKTNRATLK